ncbi:hypothetical protein LEP1GSC125_3248 [Leptospira mayottensis 200901122]|uniref:Uncharacterized protein n=1 Tax=Leptospira mayottensis 200901122 TaxID=1193010 RepID=A0AA87SW50_9LEPT|nr:hypothetical protein LEP1GSC125_3248 [Leptospira mayottensis 200901122]
MQKVKRKIDLEKGRMNRSEKKVEELPFFSLIPESLLEYRFCI